jgi:ATP/maltotriose-dependent transcriptional regulator MalT
VRAALLYGRFNLSRDQGDYAAALRAVEESLAIRRALGDRVGIAEALTGVGMLRRDMDHVPEARALHEESLAIVREVDRREPSNAETRRVLAQVLTNLGVALNALGDREGAHASYVEALAIRHELGDRRNGALVLNNLGSVALNAGDLTAARAFADESVAIYREFGDPRSLTYALFILGRIAFQQGDLRAAADILRERLELSERVRNRVFVDKSLRWLAAVADQAGAPRRAARLFGAAERWREAREVKVPDDEQADYECHVATSRGHLEMEAFDTEWTTGRAMAWHDILAYALSDEGAGPDGSAASEAGPLSSREYEVAMLVALGLTNQQIAAELAIARSTVDRHIVHILTKLNVGNRARIAVWAATQSAGG